MRVLTVLFGLIVVASAFIEDDVAEGEWQTFKQTYGKQYADEAEELLRKQIFMEAKLKIEKHNQKYKQRLTTFSMGINQFADLTHEEFASMYGDGNLESLKESYRAENFYDDAVNFIPPTNIKYPKSMNWTEHGAVTKVKDQKSCGSGGAFSAIGALEGRQFLFTKKMTPLSEQQLIDCLPGKRKAHCKGINPIEAFQYIKQNGGIQSESSYEYTAKNDSTCKFDKTQISTSINAFGKIPSNDENMLKQAVATVGPISISIFMDDNLVKYEKGVFPAPCNTKKSHAVLLVGYGTENGKDYWLAKNSMGTSWGEEGYLKIDRRINKDCFLVVPPVYPLI